MKSAESVSEAQGFKCFLNDPNSRSQLNKFEV